MDLKQELLGIVGALNKAGVPYALCGGMAVVLHGYPRLTRDIDLLIRRQALNAAREALAAVGFKIPSGLIPFDTGGPHEREVFRISKQIGEELLTVDLLLLPDFLKKVWEGRETYELDKVLVTAVDRGRACHDQSRRVEGQEPGCVARYVASGHLPALRLTGGTGPGGAGPPVYRSAAEATPKKQQSKEIGTTTRLPPSTRAVFPAKAILSIFCYTTRN